MQNDENVYEVRIRPTGEVVLGLPLPLLEATATPLLDADGLVQVVAPPGRMPAALTSMSRFGRRKAVTPEPSPSGPYLTLAEWARVMRVSYRHARKLVREVLVEGQHYHRTGNGPKAPVIVHVEEATTAIRSTTGVAPKGSVDDLAAFRAKAALKRRKR